MVFYCFVKFFPQDNRPKRVTIKKRVCRKLSEKAYLKQHFPGTAGRVPETVIALRGRLRGMRSLPHADILDLAGIINTSIRKMWYNVMP
jgi:hypothetical protein